MAHESPKECVFISSHLPISKSCAHDGVSWVPVWWLGVNYARAAVVANFKANSEQRLALDEALLQLEREQRDAEQQVRPPRRRANRNTRRD